MGSGGQHSSFWCEACQWYVPFSNHETLETNCMYCEARADKARAAAADAAEQRAEAAEAALAQAHADRTLLTGLWLATVPPDVLPTLLPADPGDRDRLAAALDAVDLQASAGSHTAAGRAVIARIVAAAGGAR